MVTRNGTWPPNPGGGAAHGNECPGDPVAAQLSCMGSSKGKLDSLVFDTDEFDLAPDGRNAARPDATPSHESKTVQEPTPAVQRPSVYPWARLIPTLARLRIAVYVRRLGIWTTATIMISLAVAGMVSYLAWSDGYHVETKLLLFDRDHSLNNSAGRTLEEEVEILKSPHILHLLSRETVRSPTPKFGARRAFADSGERSDKRTFEVRQPGRSGKMAFKKDMSQLGGFRGHG